MVIISEQSQDAKELVSLGKNLAKLMHNKGIDTKELSALTGISVSLLNALKRGEGNPTLGTLIALANFFDVPIGSLIASDGIKQEAVRIIPVYDIKEAHHLDTIHAAKNIYLKIEDEQQKDLFGIQIDNSSLMPFFDKGSIFVLSQQKHYTDGDIVLVRMNNEYNVFRKVFVKNKGLLFQYISLEAEPHAYDHYNIIGTVIKVIHNMGM